MTVVTYLELMCTHFNENDYLKTKGEEFNFIIFQEHLYALYSPPEKKVSIQ